MRTLAPDFERYISKRLALDVCFSLDIHWEGGLLTYEDSDFLNEIRIDWVQNDIIPGASFSCDISMNMKPEFFQSKRILGTKVDLYLKVKNERELIGTGHIDSPVSYANRILDFTIFSKYENPIIETTTSDVFESIERGDSNKIWPMIFGDVGGSRCVKIRSAVIGTLESDEGITDYTLTPRMEQVKEISCPNIITNVDGDGSEASVDASCVDSRRCEYCKLKYSYEEQQETEHKTVTIKNGQDFPQNEPYEIAINGGAFQGYFSGNTFHIQGRIHPLKGYLGEVKSKDLPPVEVQFIDPYNIEVGCDVEVPSEYTYYGAERLEANQLISDIYDFCHQSENCWMTETKDSYLINAETGKPNYKYVLPKLASDAEQLGVYFNIVESVNHHGLITQILASGETITEYYNMKIAGRFVAPAGSTFSLEGAGPKFLASLVPGTVLEVLAYKTSSSAHPGKLVNIPDQYYDIYEVDYGSFTAVEIHFTKPLSQISSCLGNDVFVYFSSDVGPNPIDVIEWLIEQYTDLEIDSDSFDYVRSKTEKYPIGFTLQERKTVFQLIKDIAYQSRCALNIWDNTLYLHYMSEEPTSSLTVDTSKIYGSYTISASDIISTVEDVKWKSTYAPRKTTDPDGHRFFLKQNQEYGVHAHSSNYSCLNIEELVKKSSLFWFIRDSTPWKLVTFKGPLSLLKLNIYDGVFFEPLDTLCVVTNILVETDGVTITLWTPIRFGEVDKYIWAWPANVPPKTNFRLNYPSDLDDTRPDYNFYHYDYDCVPCYQGGEGYWGGEGYDYDDNDFSVPHGGGGSGGGEETPDAGEGVYGRPRVPYVDDFGASYNNPEKDDISKSEGKLEFPGDCWFWHYVFKATCKYAYCGDDGPCEKQLCRCSPICCEHSADLFCYVEISASCQSNLSQWNSNLSRMGGNTSICSGQTYIVDVQPRPSDSIQSCCDLPNEMWKSPGTCTDAAGRKYSCKENGIDVPCDYYCGSSLQAGSADVSQRVTDGYKKWSSGASLPGLCSGTGSKVIDYLADTGQMSWGGETPTEITKNKTTGEVSIKVKLFPDTFKEYYDSVPDAYASTAFQNALVKQLGYEEAVRVFTENMYETRVAPDGAIIYMHNGKIVYVDRSLIWSAALFQVKEYYDWYGRAGGTGGDPLVREMTSQEESTYYVWNIDAPESEWILRDAPPPWKDVDPSDPDYGRLRGAQLDKSQTNVYEALTVQLGTDASHLYEFVGTTEPIQTEPETASYTTQAITTSLAYPDPYEVRYYDALLNDPDETLKNRAFMY